MINISIQKTEMVQSLFVGHNLWHTVKGIFVLDSVDFKLTHNLKIIFKRNSRQLIFLRNTSEV